MLRLSNAALLGALLTLPAVVGGQGAGAAEPGDGQRGLQLARQVCSSCHAVEAREVLSPVSQAPTFDEVADRPGVTGMGLTVFLRTPHRSMPDLILKPGEIDDIVAHILGLKGGD